MIDLLVVLRLLMEQLELMYVGKNGVGILMGHMRETFVKLIHMIEKRVML
jgi:hypothetical protein